MIKHNNYGDIDSECHVLGIMTLSDDAYRQGCARLTTDDFTDPLNRAWFTALKKRASLSSEVRMLESAKELGGAHPGGRAHVGKLIAEYGALHRVPNVFRYYLRVVLAFTQRRSLATVARDLGSIASDESEDWLGVAEQRIKAIRDRSTSVHGTTLLGDVLPDTIDEIDAGKNTRLIGTGLYEVDSALGGLAPGENIVLAGSTGGGKTALALSIAIHNARQSRSVLYFSLEMAQRDIHKRILAHESEINLATIFRSSQTDDQRRQLVRRAAEIANWRLGVCDQPRMTIRRMREVCQEHSQTGGLDLIVCDYIQLIIADNSRASLREQVSQVSRDLKLMAREFRVPVLSLTQISREGAKESEPALWHLKESGSIENDADLVWFVYPSGEPTSEQRKKGIQPVWLKCAKNRRGSLGKIPLQFIKPYQQFRCDSPTAADVF